MSDAEITVPTIPTEARPWWLCRETESDAGLAAVYVVNGPELLPDTGIICKTPDLPTARALAARVADLLNDEPRPWGDSGPTPEEATGTKVLSWDSCLKVWVPLFWCEIAERWEDAERYSAEECKLCEFWRPMRPPRGGSGEERIR